MKTILNLKLTLGLLLTLNLQSTFIHQLTFNLYAQDPELFEHTWYFVTGELDGEIFFQPPEEHIIEVNFSNDEIYLCYPSCSECLSNYVEITEDSFIVSDIEPWIVLIGFCNPPENEFIDVHNSVYFFSHENSKNPFTYNIDTVDDYLQVTIENGEGDWAVYNSVLLSNQGFNQNNFTIYPNPVIEILQISQQTAQKIDISIFDVNGKKLQKYTLENSVSTIDVKELYPGLYFVVFENETGKRVSKKFIKQ